jgi:hypothetical protein
MLSQRATDASGGPGGNRTHPNFRLKRTAPPPGGHGSELVLPRGTAPRSIDYQSIAQTSVLRKENGQVRFRSSPLDETGFTDPMPEPPALPAHMMLPPGIEPRSTVYRTVALPLCYGSMAERPSFELDALRHNRVSNPLQPLAACTLQNWRRGGSVDLQTFRFHRFSGPCQGPPWIPLRGRSFPAAFGARCQIRTDPVPLLRRTPPAAGLTGRTGVGDRIRTGMRWRRGLSPLGLPFPHAHRMVARRGVEPRPAG